MTRYELLDRIGVGGMAEIFRGKAVAAGGFEKPVAIKRILPHLSQDRRFVELLIAEAKVLSLLKHRNIVQIFDVGLGDDGQYFLVMEYVDGKDVGAIQRALETQRRRLPFDLCLHIGAEICEALEHAHTSRGPDGKPMALVHRDVSPSNVLLSRAGEVKLTDFGIAKRAESDATQGGAVRGKFAYIAPEQARNEPLDPRSDVFSVGILLWELICNRRLFSGLDDLAALRAVRDPLVPRPTQVDSSLPAEVDQILLTALAKDKTRRYASCGQLGQKLRALRYSLDVTVGDPATELAKVIDSTEQFERESKSIMADTPTVGIGGNPFDFDLGGESTVIRIQTADEFNARDQKSLSKARMAIDHFEEEQTRQATLTGDQLRLLRSGDRDSVEMTAEKPRMDREASAVTPLRTPGRVDDDDMTRAREPLDPALAGYEPPIDTPPHQRLTPGDDTRLVAPRDRRTPVPALTARPASTGPKRAPTVPPPVPTGSGPRPRGPTPGPPPSPQAQQQLATTMQGTPAPVPMAPLPQAPQMQHPSQQQNIPPPLQPNVPVQTHTPLPYASTQPAFNPYQSQQGYQQAPPQPYYAPPHAQQPQSHPGWGQNPLIAPQHPPRDATPTTKDQYDRPVYPQGRPSMPDVAGFPRPARANLHPAVLIVGAIVMALIAFLITRAAIG